MKKDKKKLGKNIFWQRMDALGYDDVTDFVRGTNVPLSFETARRAIYDDRQNIRHDYIVILMQYLDFTTNEIREELVKRGDKYLHKLIDDSKKGVVLNEQETFILTELRKQPNFVPIIMEQLSMKNRILKETKKKG